MLSLSKHARPFSLALLTAAGLALSLAAPATAQTYPDRPIRAVLSIAAGSSGDIYLRQIAAKASVKLGQNMIVDNRVGGAGIVGTNYVARAAPDGYTLVFAYNQTMAVAPHISKNLPYDPATDFVGVARAVTSPLIVVVTSTLPVNSVPELVAWAKANPGKLSYASSGAGTSSHLAGAYLESIEKVGAQHIPYTSVPQALSDIGRGDIKIMIYPYAGLVPAIDGKTVRILAVTGPKRLAILKDTPTMVELGYSDFVISPWFAFFAPAQTPRPIVQKLNDTIAEVMRDPEIVAAMDRTGTDVWLSTPDELTAFTKTEIERYRKLVAIAGIQPE